MAKQDKVQSKPKVFIGSSSAGLGMADQIQKNLLKSKEVLPTVWNQEDWLNKYTLERLIEILDEYDFAVFVFRPDDSVEIKGEAMKVTRDNVLLELGLFMGRHNRKKVFVVFQDDEDMRVASDLLGLNFGLVSGDSKEELAVVCNDIKSQMLEIWQQEQQEQQEQQKAIEAHEDNPLPFETGLIYRLLNAASLPHYKSIDYTSRLKPFFPRELQEFVPFSGDQSLAKISEVRKVVDGFFNHYMLSDLKTAQHKSQRLRIYFAYYLGDGVPLAQGEPFYCRGRDENDNLVKGEFVIGVSTSEESSEKKWKSGLPLGGYDKNMAGKALSNAAAAFSRVEALAIDDTENPPRYYKHFNFKVEDERAVYSVPVLLSDQKLDKPEFVATIGILTVSGSDPNMIDRNIKDHADHLAILLGIIFFLHAKQNKYVPQVAKEVGVTKFPIGFTDGSETDFMRRAVSLRREVAKHFEEYFIQRGIHKFEGGELLYTPSES